jgi:hypothetical protein
MSVHDDIQGVNTSCKYNKVIHQRLQNGCTMDEEIFFENEIAIYYEFST